MEKVSVVFFVQAQYHFCLGCGELMADQLDQDFWL
jgi:hypothetical protein